MRRKGGAKLTLIEPFSQFGTPLPPPLPHWRHSWTTTRLWRLVLDSCTPLKWIHRTGLTLPWFGRMKLDLQTQVRVKLDLSTTSTWSSSTPQATSGLAITLQTGSPAPRKLLIRSTTSNASRWRRVRSLKLVNGSSRCCTKVGPYRISDSWSPPMLHPIHKQIWRCTTAASFLLHPSHCATISSPFESGGSIKEPLPQGPSG